MPTRERTRSVTPEQRAEIERRLALGERPRHIASVLGLEARVVSGIAGGLSTANSKAARGANRREDVTPTRPYHAAPITLPKAPWE